MNLSKKKKLAMRTFGVGKDRIIFVESRIDDIKEAITKQDMRDLKNRGIIIIKEIGGRKKVREKASKSSGNIRKIPGTRKRNYIDLTRKLRRYLAEMKKAGRLSKNTLEEIRKKIRNKYFRSKSHLKEYLKETGGTTGASNENVKKKKKTK